MDIDNGTMIFIVGFIAAWAAAVVLVAGLFMLKAARRMRRHRKSLVEVADFWRDM